MIKTYVLYHANCMDGFGAAWACWKKFGTDNVTYIPVQYGEQVPTIEFPARVFIVDFSYPRETLLSLRDCNESLQVIDHHKTAQKALEGLDFCLFDMNKSGAVLTHEFLFPGERVPDLLLYIQDRDLWQWQLHKSKEINAALATYQKEFTIFNALHTYFNPETLASMGDVLLRNQKQVVNSLADKAFFDSSKFSFRVPMINSSTLQSELGNELCYRHKDCKFAAIFFYLDLHTRVWSLRSVGDFDVSEIAKLFGGGGHKNAAGFKEEIL